MVKIGDRVQIKRGFCGEGFRFDVSTVVKDQVYGDRDTYGPVRVSEIEVVAGEKTFHVEGSEVTARTAARRINAWEGHGCRYVYAK